MRHHMWDDFRYKTVCSSRLLKLNQLFAVALHNIEDFNCFIKLLKILSSHINNDAPCLECFVDFYKTHLQ